jgi:hypothetical protein
MRRELREYLLWRAGYRAGEKPDASQLMYRSVDIPLKLHSCRQVLKRAGFAEGQRPSEIDITFALRLGQSRRKRGIVPDFPIPNCRVESIVKRQALTFFLENCSGLRYVDQGM